MTDYLAAKDRSAAEHSDTRSTCPACGEWRDSPASDCASCGYAPDDSRPNDDPAVSLAEAIMADLDCADVFGHRDELTASIRRHIATGTVKEARVRSVLAKWLDTAPVDDSIMTIEEELADAGNDWLER